MLQQYHFIFYHIHIADIEFSIMHFPENMFAIGYLASR